MDNKLNVLYSIFSILYDSIYFFFLNSGTFVRLHIQFDEAFNENWTPKRGATFNLTSYRWCFSTTNDVIRGKYVIIYIWMCIQIGERCRRKRKETDARHKIGCGDSIRSLRGEYLWLYTHSVCTYKMFCRSSIPLVTVITDVINVFFFFGWLCVRNALVSLSEWYLVRVAVAFLPSTVMICSLARSSRLHMVVRCMQVVIANDMRVCV